jgi:hypothetical protein
VTEFEKAVKTTKPIKVTKIGEGRFHARLAEYADGWKAIIKRAMHDGVFRKLPTVLAPEREEAMYHVSQLIYPGVVPETYKIKHDGETSSAQLWVPGFHVRSYDSKVFNKDRDDFYTNIKKVCYQAAPKEAWKRLTMLDIIANSRDRHGKNVMVRPKRAVPFAAIDNSFCLGLTFRGYRNVFHQYLFNWHYYDPALLREVGKLTVKDFVNAIGSLLPTIYGEHCMRRLEWVQEYPHRLPWRIMSQGAERSIDFPTYEEWFATQFRRLPQRPVIVKAVDSSHVFT